MDTYNDKMLIYIPENRK